MKQLIMIALMLVGVPTFAQVVEFDKSDVETLRQLQLQLCSGKTMTTKQLKQFETINTHVQATAKLPIAALDNDLLIEYANRLYFDYMQYKQNESNARKFINILKRLHKADPLVMNKIENGYLSDDQKKQLLNEIK
ncbi:hypothetical protein [Flavobacterium sp.]|jgi:hypothetical protein|uniref:hypothetical protein n=1 Tax=Flavobacterium sp. TaxID=239 RepID=UPI0037C06FA7